MSRFKDHLFAATLLAVALLAALVFSLLMK